MAVNIEDLFVDLLLENELLVTTQEIITFLNDEVIYADRHPLIDSLANIHL